MIAILASAMLVAVCAPARAQLANSPSLAPESPSSSNGSVSGLPASANSLMAYRPTTDDRAKGRRLGAFILSTNAGFGLGPTYTSNVFGTGNNRKSDFTNGGAATATLASDWVRHSLVFNALVGTSINMKYTSESQVYGSFGASGTLEVQRDLTVSSFAKYSTGSEARGIGDSFFLYTKPIKMQTIDAGTLIHKSFNRVWVEAGGTINYNIYEAPTLAPNSAIDPANNLFPTTVVSQSYRNGGVYTVLSRVGYDVSPKTSVFVEGAYNTRKYDDSRSNSHGFRAYGGIRYEFSQMLRGQVSGGYVGQDLNSVFSNKINTFGYQAQLQYKPTPFITATFVGSRDVGAPSQAPSIPGIDTAQSIRVVSEVGTQVSYSLFRSLPALAVGVAYQHADYYGIDTGGVIRSDHGWVVNTGLGQMFNWGKELGHLTLFANYQIRTYYTNGLGITNTTPTAVTTGNNLNYWSDQITLGARAHF